MRLQTIELVRIRLPSANASDALMASPAPPRNVPAFEHPVDGDRAAGLERKESTGRKEKTLLTQTGLLMEGVGTETAGRVVFSVGARLETSNHQRCNSTTVVRF